MDARTVNGLPPAAAHDGAVRCAMAIELSKTSWIVAVNTPMSEKISRYTLKGCDRNGLLDLIKKIRARAGQEFERPVEVVSCYEAGYDGSGFIAFLKRMACAITSLIRRACRSIAERGERRQTVSMWPNCCAR